jgi:hypothetical protein
MTAHAEHDLAGRRHAGRRGGRGARGGGHGEERAERGENDQYAGSSCVHVHRIDTARDRLMRNVNT